MRSLEQSLKCWWERSIDMLMLINPFDVVYSRRYMNISNMLLTDLQQYYVLDTDDLEVTHTNYSELYNIIINLGIEISNVVIHDGSLYMCKVTWGFTGLAHTVKMLNGTVIWHNTNIIEFKDVAYPLSLDYKGVGDSDTVLYNIKLGTRVIYAFTMNGVDLGRLDVLYVFKCSSYLVFRTRVSVYVRADGSSVHMLVTLVFTQSGDLVDCIGETGMPKSKVDCLDSAFMTKLITVVGMRY